MQSLVEVADSPVCRKRRRSFGTLLRVVVAALHGSLLCAGERVEVTRQSYHMGTLCTFTTLASQREQGLKDLEELTQVVDETERQLSTWHTESWISRLNRQSPGAVHLDSSSCELLEKLRFWTIETDRAFDPVIGSLIEVWGLHGTGRWPSEEELQAARQCSGWERLGFIRSSCLVNLQRGANLDSGAFGKGEALDRVAARAGGLGLGSWLVDLGGQAMAGGSPQGREFWTIPLAHPRDRNRPLVTLALKEGSLATSGGSERDLKVDRGRIGHILDPRTGYPVENWGAVTVWHTSGLVADILSTALYVKRPEQGMRWANRHHVAACFLVVNKDGVEIRKSQSFAERFSVSAPKDFRAQVESRPPQ
ncbi:MAG: FAD:protein FMN transferase [Acidobacteriota bacterium]